MSKETTPPHWISPSQAPTPSRPWSVFLYVNLIGWLWSMLALIVLGLGLAKQINLLILLACPLISMWFIQLLVGGRGVASLQARRSIRKPIFAGSQCTVATTVKNGSRLRRCAVVLEEEGISRRNRTFITRLAGKQSLNFRNQVTIPQRGKHVWGPLVAKSGYPFGLSERTAELVPKEEVLVLPQLGKLDAKLFRRFLRGSNAFYQRLASKPNRRMTAQTEFHGLRSFRSGDSQRLIHWRTTARRGELMVREFEETAGEHLMVIVDPRLPANKSRYRIQLDDVISFAATLCLEWPKQNGGQFLFALADEDPIIFEENTRFEHAIPILEKLAIQSGTRDSEETLLMDRFSSRNLPPGPILLLSISTSPLGEVIVNQLNRSVTRITAKDLRDLDFYDLPEVLLSSGPRQD
jgi:uncharacterized protein (DUF58 family)